MPGSDETPEPTWPSSDHDTDRDATASGDGGVTDQLRVPKVSNADPPTIRVSKPEAGRAGQADPPTQQAAPRQPAPQSPQVSQQPPPPPPRFAAQQPQQVAPQPPQQQPPLQQPQQQPPQQPPQQPLPRQQPQQSQPQRYQPQRQPSPPPPPLPLPPSEPAGTGPSEDNTAEPAVARRGKGLRIGAVLAVLLLVATGVTLALPDVSNRLGLPWAPNAPKAQPPEPVAVTRELRGPSEAQPAPTQAGVASALQGPASAGVLGTLTGSVVDPDTGTVLWEREADRPLTPASTIKLLTFAAALLALDHGTQFPTTVVQGEEPGTVVLVAGGDVTLSSLPSGEQSVYPGAAHLDDLVTQVKEATGGSVTEVRLDPSIFAEDPAAPGWAPGDSPSTFMAPVQPAMLDGGRREATDPNSMRYGDPAAELVRELANRLGAKVGEPLSTPAPQGARVLGEVRSAPLAELVDRAMLTSDNLVAEVLARQVAIAQGKEPSFEGGAQATLQVLGRNGFDVSGVELSDASGLSTKNRVPAALLSEVLAVAADPGEDDPRTAKLRPLLGGLPVAGGSGTLSDRYTEGAATEGRGWVRAKTGTLSGANTLAGLVLDQDGRVLVFAFMSSGTDIKAARAALDELTATLRGCGCR
ncbi:D-alanyl-D-alanine carboxypeptidase, serine-type, PBP4 family [Saccharomonospora marina XMU15]|uniref:D-alanyl-D-alanine carboxypeptidase, serine-type, PBP4 family n=1 Tax=Saccharomonospora marina XMU15 TaxID=882083 RepID=H5X234_9PSEU|nr:D-alanyl-D-alanine carboxypeptidase/D-alanyl-D-alanine-endopeptidase [Saccharomonospora marina]EHR53163.1 D-alanyl-D-alanine carboxypeptidase, serine-type, PBP4 family [Saccharomonospora marina XMU15]